MIRNLIDYTARREDLQGCFVPACCMRFLPPLPSPPLLCPPGTSHRSEATELITAALVQSHQIGFSLSHNKSPKTESGLKQTTGCLCLALKPANHRRELLLSTAVRKHHVNKFSRVQGDFGKFSIKTL